MSGQKTRLTHPMVQHYWVPSTQGQNFQCLQRPMSKYVKAADAAQQRVGVGGWGWGRAGTVDLGRVHAPTMRIPIQTKQQINQTTKTTNQIKIPHCFSHSTTSAGTAFRTSCRRTDTFSSCLLPSTTATFAMSLELSPELRSVVQCQS